MYDIAIKNGSIIDPVAKKITVANLYIKDGSISEISREDRQAAESIDATAKYVSPGFIDIHGHIEGHKANGALLCQQGVTTVVNGNCGIGQQNIGSFLNEQSKSGFIINQLELSGASTLRERVGQQDRYAPLSPEQLEAANALLEEDLQAGAAGLSFGLEYMPGSSHEEVITLSKTAAKYGKPVGIHIRTDCYKGLTALEEAIDISRLTGAGVQISHVVYQFGFGMMQPALELIDKAVTEGYDISCDSGMYTSFATHIGTAVFDEECFEKWKCSYGSIIAANGKYAGQFLTKESYEDLRKNYPGDAAIAMIGKPYEIAMAFALPYMMVSSDAGVNQTDDTSKGHPQDAGTFPRFIRELVRERNQLTLVDAIRRVTILPAERMGLSHKGRITVGNDADITVFDLNTITDNSQFPHIGKPDALPSGIEAVIVGGAISINNKKVLCSKAGKAIYVPSAEWRY